MAPSRRPPTMTCRRSMACSSALALGLVREAPAAYTAGDIRQCRVLLPAFHRPFELDLGRLLRPDQLVGLVLQLDQIGRGQDILPGLVKLDAVIAHHQLLGL